MDWDKIVKQFKDLAQRFKYICPICSAPKTEYQVVCFACKQQRGYE